MEEGRVGWGEKEKFLREISLSSTLLLQNLERQEKMDGGCRGKDFKITLSLLVPPPLSPDFKKCAWWFNTGKNDSVQFSSVHFSTCPSPSRTSYTWRRACALTVTLTRVQSLNLIKKEEKQKKGKKKRKTRRNESKHNTVVNSPPGAPDECQADILRWLMKCQAGACVYRRPPLLKSWRALFSRENASGAGRRRLCCN